MAKKQAKAVTRPGASIAANARRIVAAHVADFYAREQAVTDPARSVELHEMRIVAKQLRYAMELFAPALGPDATWCTDAVKTFQELVGEIHDADVRAVMLRDYLRARAVTQAETLMALASADDVDVDALKTQVHHAAVAKPWVAEQAALAAAIARTLAGQRERHAHLREQWATWQAEGLRTRLDALSHAPAPHQGKGKNATTFAPPIPAMMSQAAPAQA